jgi:hypothetical protein
MNKNTPIVTETKYNAYTITTIDKHWQKILQDIVNSASDREQLRIIEYLVESLRDLQEPYYEEDSVEALYFNNLTTILKIIETTLKKEKNYEQNRKNN